MTGRAQGPLLPIALLTVAATTVVFALDMLVPLGIAGGVPYLLAVWIALMAWRPRFTLAVAVGCSLLVLVGWVTSPDFGTVASWKVLTNRGLALFAVWVTAIFGLICQRRHRRASDPEAWSPPSKPVAFAYRGTVLLLSAVIVAALGLLLLYQYLAEDKLLKSAMQHDARAMTSLLRNFRTIYTSEVVAPARKQGVVVTHDYKNVPGAIPLPVTLGREMSNRAGREVGGVKTKLYSPYYFPWREGKGGLRDRFARDAWEAFQKNAQEPFFRYERMKGGMTLRYATADLMRQSCIDCHNNHRDSPKKDWQVDDVRGVLEVRVPMEPLIGQRRLGMRQSVGLFVGLGGVGIAILALVIGRLQRTRVELEHEVARRTAELRAMDDMEKDMSAASKIHRRLLPQETPRVRGFDIAGACLPVARVAGDYYDYVSFPDGSLGIVVADVSGHGLAPALAMAGTRRLLRSLAETNNDLSKILAIANVAVEQDADPGRFVTLFFARIDPAERWLTYASAGHPGYLLRADGQVETLAATTMPLGLVHDLEVPTSEPSQLEGGDILLLCTDGFEEARAVDGSWFGRNQLWDLARDHRRESAERIAQVLQEAVQKHCQPETPQDDLTLVVVKVR